MKILLCFYSDTLFLPGFGGNTSHTFHIHGYNASILGRNSFGRPITKEEIVLLDSSKQLHRNVENPPQKDSFVVPNKGYVILRLFTDNLGETFITYVLCSFLTTLFLKLFKKVRQLGTKK